MAHTRHTVKRSVSNETLRFLLCCLGALVLAAFAAMPRAAAAAANAMYVSFGSYGNVVLAGEMLTAHLPKLHDRRYELILSGGTCSAPALGAGPIVISPKNWVLDGGLKATAAFSMPRSGHLLLLDLRDRHHSRFVACADLVPQTR